MIWLLVILAAIVIGVLLVASSRPGTFRLERAITVQAPADTIFPLIADFRNWTGWSPWENIDPDLKRSYGGAESGVGASYGWVGRKAGQGNMEIIEATAPSLVRIKLDFVKPFEAHNTAEFTLRPDGDGTRVTWAMFGPNLFMGKLMSVFVNMDRIVGKDFEKGLASLKAAAESGPRGLAGPAGT